MNTIDPTPCPSRHDDDDATALRHRPGPARWLGHRSGPSGPA